MKCPIHKDIEMIMNVFFGMTFYHCWKCAKMKGEYSDGGWKVTEIIKYMSDKKGDVPK